jgi:hypothetical protein
LSGSVDIPRGAGFFVVARVFTGCGKTLHFLFRRPVGIDFRGCGALEF